LSAFVVMVQAILNFSLSNSVEDQMLLEQLMLVNNIMSSFEAQLTMFVGVLVIIVYNVA
jgi:hypothetical protein